MNTYIRIQYQRYKSGKRSIDVDKLKILAKHYLPAEEYTEMFGGDAQ